MPAHKAMPKKGKMPPKGMPKKEMPMSHAPMMPAEHKAMMAKPRAKKGK